MAAKYMKQSAWLGALHYYNGIEVTAYDMGVRLVIPNPENSKAVKEAEEALAGGIFIGKRTKSIAKHIFNDPENWSF